MADTAHRLTDKKLEEMEKRLSAIYSRTEKEIGERWKGYLVESQAEIDELQKAYELAKKGGDAKEIRKAGKKLASAKRERTLMDKRFKDLTEATAFSEGEQGWWGDRLYTSNQDGNVWTPEAYPAGWTVE